MHQIAVAGICRGWGMGPALEIFFDKPLHMMVLFASPNVYLVKFLRKGHHGYSRL